MNASKINTLDELRESVKAGHHDYFIALKPGGLRSSKEIDITPSGEFAIFSSVSGTVNTYDDQALALFTNIPEAIAKGAFYQAN